MGKIESQNGSSLNFKADWHYEKKEIDEVVKYMTSMYESEKKEIKDETKKQIEIDPELRKLIRKDIKIASEIALWKHKDMLQSILNNLKNKNNDIKIDKINDSKDCIRVIQIIFWLEPDWIYWSDTFKAVTKFQYENDNYKNNKCPELEDTECIWKDYTWWLVDWFLNWRFVNAIEKFVKKENFDIKKQKVNQDLTEEQSKEKLKKMTKNPENYFRWSIENYQWNLKEYNEKLPKLSKIKVPAHWDLHIEQLIFNWTVPALSDFDESHTNWVLTNDLIRILASIKTWWWNESLQNTFLDTYIKSLNNKKIDEQIPKSLSEKLKTNEKQENLADWSNKFINFKDWKFQNSEKDWKIKEIKHIDKNQKVNLQNILKDKNIVWEIVDWRIDSSNWVWSFWMTKYVVAVRESDNKIRFYEFKQQSSIHTAKNIDWKDHKNKERQNIAKKLWQIIEVTKIDWRKFTISEIVPNYNKFPPEWVDLKNDKESFNYWVQAVAVELAKLHSSKSNQIINALNDNNEKANLIKCADDFSEKNVESYKKDWGK